MKPIDWLSVPRGTMTNCGELMRVNADLGAAFVYDGVGVVMVDFEDLLIAPQERWTYHDGGECPVPAGLTCETITRMGHQWDGDQHTEWVHTGAATDGIAYRITGVDRARGYTDRPEEVTE